MPTAPFYPIVYIRGYAGTQGEVEDTVADPYMGFNLGATKIRQKWTQEITRHVFESPVIRLMKDHDYRDVYEGGEELPVEEEPPDRAIYIYRYYEPVSRDLGSGQRPEMESYAEGLHDFIEQIRDHYCGPADNQDAERKQAREEFRVHIVAHSMGGLIARCYLQNVCRKKGIRPPVDRVVTYATPHGGIDFRVVGNVPSFFSRNNVDNFNRRRMREYLAIQDDDTPVTALDGAFPPERFHCLVGTNHRDYTAAQGVSRRAVGSMSDGLVRIQNAVVDRAPRAFMHRAHSGHYGIVNSEEGYQNLRRFLFGDVRVDVRLAFDEITLPPQVARRKEDGHQIRASYHVETVVRVRGERTSLHRRTTEDESALFVDYDRYVKGEKSSYLASIFLMDAARINRRRRSLGFSVDLRVLVPEYVVDGRWFRRDHFEGGYLFREKLNLDLTLDDEDTKLRWGLDTATPNRSSRTAEMQKRDDQYTFSIPVEQNTRPGLKGHLIVTASAHE